MQVLFSNLDNFLAPNRPAIIVYGELNYATYSWQIRKNGAFPISNFFGQ
jgi:hypothetical protein